MRPVYRFGDEAFYADIDESTLENNGCNPYMETEDDYKVKLGGFLEERLLPHYTIHSELNRIYQSAGNIRQRPDLTIHTTKKIWATDKDRIASMVCVIELKGANLKDPNYDFAKGNIEADIRKLASLPSNLVRCLIIMDEANRVSSGKRWKHENVLCVYYE